MKVDTTDTTSYSIDTQDNYLTLSCQRYLQAFQYPIFEILLFLQVRFHYIDRIVFYCIFILKVLVPFLYEFMVPCISSYCLQRYTENIQDEEQVRVVWNKSSTVLLGSWAHW